MYHRFYWLMHFFIFGTLCGDYIGSGQDNHGILNQGCFNTAYAAQNTEQNRQNFARSLSLEAEEPLDLRCKHANDTSKNLDVSASNPTLSFQKVEDIAIESEKQILWHPIKSNTVSAQNLKSLSYGLLEKPHPQIDLNKNYSQQAKLIVTKSQNISYENFARTSGIQQDKANFCGSISAENVDLTQNTKFGNSLDLIKEDRDNISPKCHKKKDDIYSKAITGSSKQNWNGVMSNYAEMEKEREKSNKIPIIESTDECEKACTYKAPVKQPLTCKNRKRKNGSKGQDDCEGSGTKKSRLKTHLSDATGADRGQASVKNPVTMESQPEQQVRSKEENIDSTFDSKSVKKKKGRYDFIKKHIDNLTKNTQIISYDLESFKEYCKANKDLQTECKNQFVIHQHEYLMDVKNDCNETVSAVLEVTKGLSYSATLDTIEKRFKETKTTTEHNLNFTDLEYKDGLPPVTRHAKCLLHGKKEFADFIKKSNFLLKVCCTGMANGISLVTKCNIFSYFVCEMLLSRDSTTGKLRLKPELRKLQLFMPEIYFYVFWRLQFIAKIVAFDIGYQHKFQDEMHCIYFLVESFYRYMTTYQYYVFCLKTKENMIVKYRRFIKELLEANHFESVQYCFYEYALILAANTEKQTNKKVTADVMFILAFTAQSAAFEEIARDFNLEKKSKKGQLDQTDESKHQNDRSESAGNKKDEEIPDKRTRRKIGNQKPRQGKKDKDQVGTLVQGKSTQAKKKFLSCFYDSKIRCANFRTEIISLLQNLVGFMINEKSNASSTSLKDDQNSYLIFKFFTIIIANAENKKVVNIKILHNRHIRRHIYD